MRFEFKKLYADLITRDGDVCIVYLAWLNAWGFRTAFAGLELYWADGRREVIRAKPTVPQLFFEGTDGTLEVRLHLPGGPFVLRYEQALPAWKPHGPAPCEGLNWCVKVPRGEAVARWLHNEDRPYLTGRGYVDWVEIHRLPRRLGLRQVDWGRIHRPDATVVFNRVRFRSGSVWMRAAEWSGGSVPLKWDSFRLESENGSTRLELPGEGANADSCLWVRPSRTLHSGPALDAGRFPTAVERFATHVLTGPTDEIRLLSRVDGGGLGACGTSWALHERVRFG